MITKRCLCLLAAGAALSIVILIPYKVAEASSPPLGVDVSNNQGSINWSDVAGAGINFAWAKATEGISFEDAYLPTNEASGTAAGVYIGAYDFAHPEDNTPSAEAQYFVSYASKYSAFDAGHLVPALDLETGSGAHTGAASLSAWVLSWCQDVFELTGATPVVYTGTSYASMLNSSVTTNPLWLADWTYSQPAIGATPGESISPWSTWTFWQYSDKGSISGISGNVDLDAYNGTLSAMIANEVLSSSSDMLIWNPGGSTTGGTDGNSVWNTSGKHWYDNTTVKGPVIWATGDGAIFGSGSASQYTVTLSSDVSSGQNVTGLSNNGPFIGLTVNAGANYTLNGSTNLYTLTENGRLQINGNLTLQNITVDNSVYNHNIYSSISGVYNGQLNIGSGAYVKAQQIDAGGGSGDTGTINIDSGGTLALAGSGILRLQIDSGMGPAAGSGGIVNVNGGTVTLASGGIIWLSNVNTAGGASDSVGTLNVGPGGTAGSVTAPEIESASNAILQTGVLNLYSGTVILSGSTSITTGEASGGIGATLNVNVSDGTLDASGAIRSGAGSTTTMDVSGGSVSATSITGSGTTNLTISGSGTVTATSTGGSINSVSGGATTVNLNGGTLAVYNITAAGGGATNINFNGGTLKEANPAASALGILSSAGGAIPTDSVLSGGAMIDNNSSTIIVYSPLLAAAGSTGGLTIENSGSGGSVTLTGANTYTGPTEVQSGATLQLELHNGAAATIADTSQLHLDAGGTFDMTLDPNGQQISIGGLTVSGGNIDVTLSGNALQNLLVGSTANITGSNVIDVALADGVTSLSYGQYNLIADSSGGLSGPGDFSFIGGLDRQTVTIGSDAYLLTLGNTATLETLSVSAVPEPAALVLLAAATLALIPLRRRRSCRNVHRNLSSGHL